eukprot:666880-Prymnesium_polylepis.1
MRHRRRAWGTSGGEASAACVRMCSENIARAQAASHPLASTSLRHLAGSVAAHSAQPRTCAHPRASLADWVGAPNASL